MNINDGGRAAAGFHGKAGDCAVRAIAIATGRDYATVYAELRDQLGHALDDGTDRKAVREYMAGLGWKWTPTMRIGQGCRVHLRAEELPAGRLVVSVSRHLVAVVDGIIHDTYDPSRNGTRCVYGYWSAPNGL